MVDALYGGTFMLKSEDKEWQLFETLSKNSLYHMSASGSDRLIAPQKWDGIYEVGNYIDIHKKMNEMS